MSKIKIYKASAGSGKTYTLAKEYIKELLTASVEDHYRHILAVTFTKEATGEMKDRILAELYGLAFATQDSTGFFQSIQEALHEAKHFLNEQQIREKSQAILHTILHDYSRLNITTIDSFFQKVLRNLARELGKGSKFNLEMNTGKVLNEAVHATIEKAHQNKQILEWLTTYIEHKLDDDRNWRIEKELLDFSRCIYDEFFQEHEQQLRQQIQDNPQLFKQLHTQQEKIKRECKTFFMQTGQKVGKILNDNNLSPEDFIRKGIPIQFFRKLAEGDYTVKVNKTLQDCCTDTEAWVTKTHKRKDEIIGLVSDFLQPLLNDTLKMLQVVLTSRLITGNLHQLGLVWDITKEITNENAENNRFMLSDTAMFLNEMIDGSDAPFIYEKIGTEVRHVMIDEFQDTSRLQWNNFKALLSNIIANDDFSLIVGDVKQSIYRWRNGDWHILNQVGNELHAVVKSLEYNYRSEKTVIDFNNAFFPHAAGLLTELYQTKFSDASHSPFLSAYAASEVVQKTHKTVERGFVSVDFTDDMQEAVLQKLRLLQENGIPADEICILTRTNKDIRVLADYLAAQQTENPVLAENYYLNIVSNEAFQLKSSPAIQIMIEALKTIAFPENTVSREQLAYFLQASPDLTNRHELSRMPLFELIGYLYRRLELEKIEGQSAYLFAFYDAVSKYLNERPADIPNFLQYWDEELKTKAIPAGAGVSGIRAMTIHKSKGLQFHTVVIPYCDWSINPKNATTVWCSPKADLYDLELLPVAYTQAMSDTVFASEYETETAQSWLDNLNLLYVAFTRAEHNLILLAKQKKTPESVEKITTVSDLLQLSINGLHFEKGTLDNSQARIDQTPDNPLKQTPPSLSATFTSNEFQPGKSIFKQSNQSREFIRQEASKKETYVSYGNIMHHLFEQIHRMDDIERAIDNLILQGVILPAQKEDLKENIRSAIVEANVEHWFSDNYRAYREYSILTEEDGEVVGKRPDRVLFSENATLVIDYKFGEPHKSHQKQVRQYMELLKNMNYPQVEGYLWYVEKRIIEKME
ncbi:DNA helicase [Bacteroidia bacterium]|nr:DNA helicase [Bacteroidia bacterium]